MFMKKLFPSFVLMALFLLASCSSVKNQTNSNVNEPTQKFDPIKVSNYELVDADRLVSVTAEMESIELKLKLKELTDWAKEQDQTKIDFVSNDLFLKGSDLSNAEKGELALVYFEALIELNPKDIYLKKKLAVEYIRIGQLEKARDLLQELFIGSGPDDIRMGLILGGIHSAMGNYKDSQKIYKKILAKGYDEDACVYLAKSYVSEKKYDKAEFLLSDCEKKLKGNPIFSYYKGKIYQERGNKILAQKFFSKSLAIDNTFYKSLLGLGQILEEKGKIKEVVSLYENYLKKDNENHPILSRFVKILFSQRAYGKVIPYTEQLLSLDPDDLNLKVRLGILYTDVRRIDEAKGIFREILEVVPNSDKVLFYLGSLHQESNELEKAISYFSKIPSSSKLSNDGKLQIAKIMGQEAMMKNGRSVASVESFVKEKSDESDELKVELNIMLAGLFEKKNEVKKAIIILEKIKDDKNFQENHEYYLASLLEKDNRFQDARKIIEGILDKNPENAHALNFLGYTILESGKDLDLALKYITKAVKLRPNDGYIRDSLGWYYYKTGNLVQALKEIKKAFNKEKDDLIIIKHLAIIYRDMKNYDRAHQLLVGALENSIVEAERLEILEDIEHLQKLRFPGTPGRERRLPASVPEAKN